MAKQERIEIARAVLRLQADGEQTPIHELVDQAGASVRAMERWIVEGKGGKHLDAVHDPRRGWLSSRAAVERFKRKIAARAKPQAT